MPTTSRVWTLLCAHLFINRQYETVASLYIRTRRGTGSAAVRVPTSSRDGRGLVSPCLAQRAPPSGGPTGDQRRLPAELVRPARAVSRPFDADASTPKVRRTKSPRSAGHRGMPLGRRGGTGWPQRDAPATPVALDVLGEVVAAHEAPVAQRAAEALLAGVGPPVARELVRAREAPFAAGPLAGEGALPCVRPHVGLEV
uniref:Uncharacterized protein n=1 Tax=Ixodes ricinus TaxID=34613 RepID=A0A6B0V278_IXORI